MKFRTLIFVCLCAIPSWLAAAPLPAVPGFSPNLTFYLAKGLPNSCGPGCDHWIAVEGTVDSSAAGRLRRFLESVKDTQRPIYFHSPGGIVDQAYVIGRYLRGRKAVARVGRTVVSACNAESQLDDACMKIKRVGGEVDATIETARSMCNSACVYMFLGANSREVAADATLAVHNSRLTFFITSGHPTAQQMAEFKSQRTLSAARGMTAYIRSMGIDSELDNLIKSVKFESVHPLTRAELYRFGIDKRTLVETAWTFEAAARPFIRKDALTLKDDASFRPMQWRLFCGNNNRVRLIYVRQHDAGSVGKSSLVLLAGKVRSVILGTIPGQAGEHEVWNGIFSSDVMNAALAETHLQMGELNALSEGADSPRLFAIDTVGLASAWDRLAASCAPAVARSPPPAATPPPAASAPAP